MHTNYYFLRQLAPALARRLAGLRLMEIYSQDRDEVVLIFAEARGKHNYYKPFYVKATLRPDFSGLLFADNVQRARHNSVDLFEDVTERSAEDVAVGSEPEDAPNATSQTPTAQVGRSVLSVRAALNERCLVILLEDNYALAFKFFGNRPNLLAFRGDVAIELFNQKLAADATLRLSGFDRPIDQSWDAFVRADYNHRALFPTFGKEVNQYLTERDVANLDGPTRWALIQDVLKPLEHPRYYVTELDHRPALTLLPMGDVRRELDEPMEAANRYFIASAGLTTFERERSDALRLVEKRLKKLDAQLDADLQRLVEPPAGPTYEEIGHILMANVHDIATLPGGRSPETVTLPDFYRDNVALTIRLKPDLSPHRNAEAYYRKARNARLELEHRQQQMALREAEQARLLRIKEELEAATSLKALRKSVKQHALTDAGVVTDPAELFKEVEHEGYRILIGRNARNNDLLTQRYAYKEDLWLHARDVAGSHVIVKHRAGRPFPKTVIERAAELAAWYSKRRTDSLCPVIVTPKKFVRKPKGLAEGQVVVDKEDVVMVEPRQ